MTRQEMGSLIEEESSPQTSVFGRIGRSVTAPLYGELNAPTPHPPLSARERRALRRRAATLPDLRPLVARPHAGRADFAILTDSATSTMIIAAVTLERPLFVREQTIDDVKSVTIGPYLGNISGETNLIHGMETPPRPPYGVKMDISRINHRLSTLKTKTPLKRQLSTTPSQTR